MKLALVVSAMILASVVLPTPGGPQKIIELASSRSICTRSGLPGPTRCSWPTNSSRLRGRMRSASGAIALRGGLLEESSGASGLDRRRGSSPRPSAWPWLDELPTRPLRPLPRSFIQQHAGGDGGVQAFHRAGAGNRDCAVGLRGQIAGHAVAFVADEEGDGPARSRRSAGWRARDGRGEDFHAGLAQTRQSTRRSLRRATARGRRCPPRRARLSDSRRSRFRAG